MAPERVGTGPRLRHIGTWLVTGPVGRFVGFWLDLAGALITVARRRVARRPRG